MVSTICFATMSSVSLDARMILISGQRANCRAVFPSMSRSDWDAE